MAGSAMVALPWAFQTSGMVYGLAISLVSFLVSYYTCALIIITTKNDSDYIFTLRKYFGKPGYYVGLIAPMVLIFGALTVYFLVIVDSMYPVLYQLLAKVGSMDLEYRDPNIADPHYYDFNHFSASYVSILTFVVLVSISIKRDLSVFIKLSSVGVFCVLSLILFVVYYGFHSMGNSSFIVAPAPAPSQVGQKGSQYILLFNSQFSNLAGCLCAGYFIHQCSIPIIANAAEPQNNLRNVFFGYFFVFLCYVVVGSLGYYAFLGSDFYDFMCKNPKTGELSADCSIQIQENFLTMFTADSVPALVIRLMLSVQMLSSYPLVNHFQRMLMINLFFKDAKTVEEVPDFQFKVLNLGISVVPLFFAIFYPKVGSVLSYAASISGFFMIYLVPVVAYMKMRKIEILHPLLAAALQENEVDLFIPARKTLPKSFLDSPKMNRAGRP
jgi:sodium-coupled neutral amino acid transporter 9